MQRRGHRPRLHIRHRPQSTVGHDARPTCTFNATAVDPPTSRIFSIDWKEGSNELLANLGDSVSFVTESYADDHNLKVGSPIRMTFANGDTKQFTEIGRAHD